MRDSEPHDREGDRDLLADATKTYSGAPPSFLFAALTTERDGWLHLQPGEVEPNIIEAVPDRRVVWSSLWPVSPNDTIEFELTRSGDGGSIRFRWFSDNPPDERGIGITRQRLNRKIGGDLRGAVAEYVRRFEAP